MSIPLSSNFELNAQLPLDSRIVVANTTARNAIPTIQRFEGLFTYVTADAKTYQLQGGITNADWVEVYGGSGNISPITIENTNSLFSTGLTGTGASSTANNSIFLGENAGNTATNAYNSVFLGSGSGDGATFANNSVFLGNNTGQNATSASGSFFVGNGAGVGASGATNSIFFGYLSGSGASSANNSTFIGYTAGYEATAASDSIFIGTNAGYQAANANNSTFIGLGAGENATDSSISVFIGNNAGRLATTAYSSVFLGNSAGNSATSANNAIFLGDSAGYGATNSYDSFFVGRYAGFEAAQAYYSTFLGEYAGYEAINASNSVFIGRRAGYNDSVDNNGSANDSSILIGAYTNTGGFSNSVLIGSGTLATPQSNTASNQFMLSDNITNVRWRGVEYTLPSAQASSSNQSLVNDGSGGLSWASVVGGVAAATYMFSNTASDISTYLEAISVTSYIPNALASITSSLSTTPTLMCTFATESGYPNTTYIPSGLFVVHYETQKASTSHEYYTYAEIYKRNLVGTETLLATTENSSTSSSNTTLQNTVSALTTSGITLLTSDRIVVKIYGVMVSNTSNVSIKFDDNTNARIELPSIGGGTYLQNIRRHSYETPYDYNGYAPYGSSEGSFVWTITRLTVASDGTTTKGVATNASWTNRASATYI